MKRTGSLCLLQAAVLLLALSVGAPPLQAEGDPIYVGSLHSLSGYGAPAGVSEQRAVELAVEDINARGGVTGRRLKLLTEDFRSDYKEIISGFNKLFITRRIPVLFGPNWTEFSEALAPLADRRRVVMITASGYSPTLAASHDYVLSMLPDNEVITRPLAEHLSRKRYQRLVVVKSANSYFEGLHDGLTAGLRRAGIRPAAVETVASPAQDFRPLVERLKRKSCDAVVLLLAETGDNAAFLRQARELGLKSRLYSGNSVNYDAVVSKDRAIAEGVVFFDFVAQSHPEFLERYRQRFGETPYFSAPQAYDSVGMAAAALAECGEDSEKLITCLKGRRYSGVSGEIGFDREGNITGIDRNTALFRFSSGSVVGPIDE